MSSKQLTAAEEAAEIRKSLTHILGNTITVGKVRMHAVSRERLDSLSRKIERLMLNQDGTASPNLLIDLNSKVQELQDENARVTKTSQELEASSKALYAQLEAERVKSVTKQGDLEALKAEHEVDRKNLQTELAAAKTTAASLKAEVAAARKSSDVEKATALKAASAAQASVVDRLNSDLAAINKKYKAAQDDINLSHSRIKELELEKTVVAGQSAQLRNALIKGAERGANGLQLTPQIEALLGKDAMEILKKWHTLAFDDVREQAHTLMLSAKKSKSKYLQKFSAFFKAIFDWCKGKSYKARQILLPLFKTFLDHLETGALKPIAWYRDQLIALQEAHKVEVMRYSSDRKKRGTNSEQKDYRYFWEELVSWVRVFKHRGKRGAKKTWNAFIDLCFSPIEWFEKTRLWFRSWFWPKGKGRSGERTWQFPHWTTRKGPSDGSSSKFEWVKEGPATSSSMPVDSTIFDSENPFE